MCANCIVDYLRMYAIFKGSFHGNPLNEVITHMINYDQQHDQQSITQLLNSALLPDPTPNSLNIPLA